MGSPSNNSPLALASRDAFDKIKWSKLTLQDILEKEKSGDTLLHYAARAGLWNKIPPALRDKKYWTTTNSNTTMYMLAAQSPNMDWVDPKDLTEREILRKSKHGHCIISLAITNGNFNKIPRQSITDKLLKTDLNSRELLIHFIAREGDIKKIPKELLTEELLSLNDSEGASTYHILADEGKLKDIPKKLLTINALSLKDDYGATPLLGMVQNEPELIPKQLLTEKIMLGKQFGETPLHTWATSEHWMDIPLELITKDSLKAKSPYTLLYCLISQYDRNKAWLSDNKEKSSKMNRVFYKALRHGDKKTLIETRDELKKYETSVLPKGVKRVSTLINEELKRRTLLKVLSKKNAYLEI